MDQDRRTMREGAMDSNDLVVDGSTLASLNHMRGNDHRQTMYDKIAAFLAIILRDPTKKLGIPPQGKIVFNPRSLQEIEIEGETIEGIINALKGNGIMPNEGFHSIVPGTGADSNYYVLEKLAA